MWSNRMQVRPTCRCGLPWGDKPFGVTAGHGSLGGASFDTKLTPEQLLAKLVLHLDVADQNNFFELFPALKPVPHVPSLGQASKAYKESAEQVRKLEARKMQLEKKLADHQKIVLATTEELAQVVGQFQVAQTSHDKISHDYAELVSPTAPEGGPQGPTPTEETKESTPDVDMEEDEEDLLPVQGVPELEALKAKLSEEERALMDNSFRQVARAAVKRKLTTRGQGEKGDRLSPDQARCLSEATKKLAKLAAKVEPHLVVGPFAGALSGQPAAATASG